MSTERLVQAFPSLHFVEFKITSPETNRYNCIGWAAGDTRRWWWPEHRRYWPPGVPREPTVEAFVQAFATLGYEPCDSDGVEEGVERVALYAYANGEPTHAARQLPSGRWTSKLGTWEDIEHTLVGLEGARYGHVARILRRPPP